VIKSVPNGKVEVLIVALLLRPLPGVRDALPIAIDPSMKVTEPVGAAEPLVTVAVKLTGWL
jgi:hypothetical protein